MGMLAAALGWHVGDASLHYLEQFLLDTFAGHVPGDGAVHAFLACYFVQFVDVDDAVFCPVYIPVGGLDQPKQDIFDILSDVSRLGE